MPFVAAIQGIPDQFVTDLAERAREPEDLRRLPDATVAELAASGFTELLVPARFGGTLCGPDDGSYPYGAGAEEPAHGDGVRLGDMPNPPVGFINFFQKRVANPLMRRNPFQTLLETKGRKSGEPRRTPVGGRVIDGAFWLVSEFGGRSQYVRNIEAEPRVRVRVRGQWHHGTAHLLPDDDAKARLASLPRLNSLAVRAVGSQLLTIRIDLTN